MANLLQEIFILNLSSIVPVISEKNYILNIDGTPIYANLAEKSTINLDLWNLFIAIISSNENNDFGFPV